MAFGYEYGYDYGEVVVNFNTEKALRVDDGTESFFIPKKSLHKDSVSRVGERGMLIVYPWFARLRGWIDEAGYNLRGARS